MEYQSIGTRNRAQYTAQRVQQLESIDRRHWRVEENKDDNTHAACIAILSNYIETSLANAKYHHGFHRAGLCVEIFKHMLFNLDREALSPLFLYCDKMQTFIEKILISKDAPMPPQSIENSPRREPPNRRTKTIIQPVPRAPKRFIQLPKLERHILEVAFYLKEVMSKLSGGGSPKRAGKFRSPLPQRAAMTSHELHPVLDARTLRSIKTKLRKNEFFKELPSFVPESSQEARPAFNTHQAFSSYFLCLHEVIRSVSYHSAELADCAFHLLGKVLHVIENYIVEVVGHRKKRRVRIKVLRCQRQSLRAQYAAAEIETNKIAQEAIKLSTVLTAIEYECSVLEKECEWHRVSRDLMENAIEALQKSCDQPPLWYVHSDGTSKALGSGTAVLRAHNIKPMRYLAHLLALSRSYVHVRLNDARILDAIPDRKQTLSKINHQGRLETLKMHLMNQKPVDSNGEALIKAPPQVSESKDATNALHKVSDAELHALATIHESLRAVEKFLRDDTRRRCLKHHSASTQTEDQVVKEAVIYEPKAKEDVRTTIVLSHELGKLNESWQSAFPLLHVDEEITPFGKEELHRIVSTLYSHYEEILTHPNGGSRFLSFRDFVISHFLVHGVLPADPMQASECDSHWAEFELARFIVSLHVHVSNAVSMDWIGYCAVFLDISPSISLPMPRALESFFQARRLLLGSTVIRQRHIDPNAPVVWIMSKEPSVYTLQDTVLKILSTCTSTPEFYGNTLTDKSTSIELYTEDEDGRGGIKTTLVIHIETGLLLFMQALVRDHHDTLKRLNLIFKATLINDDGTISYNEFLSSMGFLDSNFTPTKLGTIYIKASQDESANVYGEATMEKLIDELYISDLFTESKKSWLYMSAMQVASQRTWDDGINGLNEMWKHVQDRIMDRLNELKLNQMNIAMIQRCYERKLKFENLRNQSFIDIAWYSYHFLQQDISATTNSILKQQKPKKYNSHYQAIRYHS